MGEEIWKILVLFLTLAFLTALALFLWERRRHKKQAQELAWYLMRLQDHQELPELSKYAKGSLGILQSEIYKLVISMQQQSSGAQQQKEYLAGMLSDISHQIKTPLAAVTIMTDLLKNPGLSWEKRLEFTETIDSQVSRITWLVRNLLTMSQLDANMLKLKKEEIEGRKLLENVYRPFEIPLELKEISLNIQADPEIRLLCDGQWTAEALSNILKNCLEHTPAGGKISMTLSQNNFYTGICIRDNGEGISGEDLPHIFERFYKGKGDSRESVGIGLALAQKIILLQNGDISVESRPGEGTVFYIKLYQ